MRCRHTEQSNVFKYVALFAFVNLNKLLHYIQLWIILNVITYSKIHHAKLFKNTGCFFKQKTPCKVAYNEYY